MASTKLFPVLALLSLTMASCSSMSSNVASQRSGKPIPAVRTTAYTHTEADHIQWGNKNALGTELKFGEVRSAAADWSVYPVGTQFQIEGMPYVYEIDDYGSALVGSNTIDLYKPDMSTMNHWGVRHVNIRVLRWGSREKSLEVLKPRERHHHVRRMVTRLEGRNSSGG